MKRFGKKSCTFSAAVAGALTGTALTGAASAQVQAQAKAADAAAEDGIYLRLGAGASFAGDWEQDITYNNTQPFPAVPLPDGQTVDNGTGFVAAAAVGFNYMDGIRTELEYRYATTPVDAVTPSDRVGFAAPSNDDVNAHFLFTNFYFDLNNASRFTPFIGGGVGGAFVENENADRDSALAYQGRAGISYDFGAGLSADVEYIYLRTNDLSFGPNDDAFAPDGPSVRLDGDHYQSSSAMMSIRKRF